MSTKPNILILYATWHGHARDVADHIAAISLASGVEPHVYNVNEITYADIAMAFDGVIVAGSVHFGRHPRALRQFVRSSLSRFSRARTAFVSISGAAASLEGRDEAEKYIEKFLTATNWKPDLVLSCAGALPYTKYGRFTRALMRFSSRTAGRPTDTSRDFVFTNWSSVDGFTHELIDLVAHAKAAVA